MVPPAAQGVAASSSNKARRVRRCRSGSGRQGGCGALDWWFVISHLTSGSNRLGLLVHYPRLTPPQAEPIQVIVSVRILSAACRSRKRSFLRFRRVVSKVEELVDPVLHANGSQSMALIGRPQISILYKVCTVDLPCSALCEFYALRKSVTCVSSVPCPGSTPAASTISFEC
jgi:hypothetical protein